MHIKLKNKLQDKWYKYLNCKDLETPGADCPRTVQTSGSDKYCDIVSCNFAVAVWNDVGQNTTDISTSSFAGTIPSYTHPTHICIYSTVAFCDLGTVYKHELTDTMATPAS